MKKNLKVFVLLLINLALIGLVNAEDTATLSEEQITKFIEKNEGSDIFGDTKYEHGESSDTNVGYLDFSTCDSNKNTYQEEFTTYNRSSCFQRKNDSQFYYFVCPGSDSSCDINTVIDTKKQGTNSENNGAYSECLSTFSDKNKNYIKEQVNKVKTGNIHEQFISTIKSASNGIFKKDFDEKLKPIYQKMASCILKGIEELDGEVEENFDRDVLDDSDNTNDSDIKYLNLGHGDGIIKCNKLIFDRFGSQKYNCTIGGGCTLNGQKSSSTNPSANPNVAGACIPLNEWNNAVNTNNVEDDFFNCIENNIGCPSDSDISDTIKDTMLTKKDGECGKNHGEYFSKKPTIYDLCKVGAYPKIEGNGPWTWTCKGVAGGESVQCSTADDDSDNKNKEEFLKKIEECANNDNKCDSDKLVLKNPTNSTVVSKNSGQGLQKASDNSTTTGTAGSARSTTTGTAGTAESARSTNKASDVQCGTANNGFFKTYEFTNSELCKVGNLIGNVELDGDGFFNWKCEKGNKKVNCATDEGNFYMEEGNKKSLINAKIRKNTTVGMEQYCNNYDEFFDDWRLPNNLEFQKIKGYGFFSGDSMRDSYFICVRGATNNDTNNQQKSPYTDKEIDDAIKKVMNDKTLTDVQKANAIAQACLDIEKELNSKSDKIEINLPLRQQIADSLKVSVADVNAYIKKYEDEKKK